MRIDQAIATEIRDSRGTPTIEVTLRSGDLSVRASSPAGKSTGRKEAHEKRDADGKGVSDAIRGLREVVFPRLEGERFAFPNDIDKLLLELDGTEDKSHLGSNATLAVSIAGTKLGAALSGLPLWKFIGAHSGATPGLPRLYMNVLNGGAHARFGMPFQEYIIVAGGDSLAHSYEAATRAFWKLGDVVKREAGEVPLGDEGGYAPASDDFELPFRVIKEVIEGDRDLSIAIDAAATEMYHDGRYKVGRDTCDREHLMGLYESIVRKFGVMSIEDPFAEDDIEGFQVMTRTLGKEILVVGDDLTTTNAKIVSGMADLRAANAMIVKPNQIGTLMEVYRAAGIAKTAGWELIASHRSGETEDAFIADLSVGLGCYGIKAGAPTQKERVAKYDRLVEIEKEFLY
ncbi:MAG: hypothetical protein A2675_01370 [Candidatus Yonathbacteria bacterium RIFCSPHIGHO2_01_FULL_51_10]|uniref:Enolase n=1 Tax=Candidatus Yonathbacteria bacterium RIFCSPHIGHO2_01_FULL_51_10 TaxID=1802723 RepID=A0A1G2SCN5_9BACT|nr:MAG: hypothetical protein A2675_01370 [Candidatus Yonathbacteria bacterium RIFCSPHIGHO2_01_FULL_51_10]